MATFNLFSRESPLEIFIGVWLWFKVACGKVSIPLWEVWSATRVRSVVDVVDIVRLSIEA